MKMCPRRFQIFTIIFLLPSFFKAQAQKKSPVYSDSLYYAVKTAKYELAQKYIAKGADVNFRKSLSRPRQRAKVPHNIFAIFFLPVIVLDGLAGNEVRYSESVLGVALSNYGREDERQNFVRLLLKNKADPNQYSDRRYPIFIAFSRGDTAMLHELIKAGARLDVTDNYQRENCTMGTMAVYCRNKSLVKFLSREAPEALIYHTGRVSALAAAVRMQDTAMVSFLLDLKVPFADAKKNSALHEVAKIGGADKYWLDNKILLAEIIQDLQDRNLNISMQNEKGNTALHELMISDKETLKSRALFSVLLEKMPDLNIQNNDGETALHLAVRYRQNEAVSMLMAKGVDQKIKNKNGLTAADVALANNDFEIAEKFGNIPAGNKRNNTMILMSLIKHNRNLDSIADTAAKLIKNGILQDEFTLISLCKNEKYSKGCSPLTQAVSRGSIPFTQVLLEGGFDVNAKDPGSEERPLAIAVKHEDTLMIKFLLSKGACPSDEKVLSTIQFKASYAESCDVWPLACAMRRILLKEILKPENFSIQKNEKGKYGVKGCYGKTIHEFIFDTICPFNSAGYARACHQGKWAVIPLDMPYSHFDKKMTFAPMKFEFENVSDLDFYREGIFKGRLERAALAKTKGKWGIVSESGWTRTQFIFDTAKFASLRERDVVIVKESGMYGIFSIGGNRIWESKFEEIKIENGSKYAMIRKGKKWKKKKVRR